MSEENALKYSPIDDTSGGCEPSSGYVINSSSRRKKWNT